MSGEKLTDNQQVTENRKRRILTSSTNTIPGDKDGVFTLFHAIIEANKNGIALSKIEEIIYQGTGIHQSKGDVSMYQQKPAGIEQVPELKPKSIQEQGAPSLPTERYQGRGNALEWLEEHWGNHLKYFNNETDYLYQDQLKKIDPGLYNALRGQVYRKGLKLSSIVPPKKERLSKELEGKDAKTIEKGYRLGATLRMRRKRAKK